MFGGLKGLPADQREVIVLKIWHDYTFEEIGTILEISPNTAAGRYRYGLKKMKNFVKGIYERDELHRESIVLFGAAPTIPEP